MNSENPLERSRVFSHEAMNTTFAIRVADVDDKKAASVAKECFYLLDSLEGQLSRFIEGSEVSRINALCSGETLYLSESCHRCLLLAMDAGVRSHGLFDITLGARMEHRKTGAAGPQPEIAGRLVIHPDVPAITCEEPGRMIDLGGIGKGFALDEMRQILIDWDVGEALLSAGASSWLAHGSIAWPIELAGEHDRLLVELIQTSLSVSGVSIQGSHIVHPWGDDAMPVNPSRKLWVDARSAAWAEVWSTALMLVDVDEIAEVVDGADGIHRIWVDRDGVIRLVACG